MNDLKSTSFLEKFNGRTNTITKRGTNQALQDKSSFKSASIIVEGNRESLKKQVNQSTPKKLPPTRFINKNKGKEKLPKLKQPPINNNSSFAMKHLYINKIENGPPSRSISESYNSENGQGKYIFGKYLKLDDQAYKHFEFLRNLKNKKMISKLNNKNQKSFLPQIN